jgi:hypothetical protein
MLAGKIQRGELVEMGELLPDFWAGEKENDKEGRKARRSIGAASTAAQWGM